MTQNTNGVHSKLTTKYFFLIHLRSLRVFLTQSIKFKDIWNNLAFKLSSQTIYINKNIKKKKVDNFHFPLGGFEFQNIFNPEKMKTRKIIIFFFKKNRNKFGYAIQLIPKNN